MNGVFFRQFFHKAFASLENKLNNLDLNKIHENLRLSGIDLSKIDLSEKINKDVVSEKNLVILCIGESTTGLGGGNSWPSQLQRILNNIQDEGGLAAEDIFVVVDKLYFFVPRSENSPILSS